MKLLINQISVFIFAYMATISGTREILPTCHLQLYAVPHRSSEVRFGDNKKKSHPLQQKFIFFHWSLFLSHAFESFFFYRLTSFSSTLLLLLHGLIAA